MIDSTNINSLEVLNKFYPQENELKHIILTHSKRVADYAVAVAKAHPELNADISFIYDAGLLHDIGCFLCDAPSVYCFGKEPYIRHGHLGAELLRKEGLDRHADVCERHTGAGLSLDYILKNQLPVPHRNLIPQNIEEEIICYADKFFSKSNLNKVKSPEAIKKSLDRYDAESGRRWNEWHKRFAIVMPPDSI